MDLISVFAWSLFCVAIGRIWGWFTYRAELTRCFEASLRSMDKLWEIQWQILIAAGMPEHEIAKIMGDRTGQFMKIYRGIVND